VSLTLHDLSRSAREIVQGLSKLALHVENHIHGLDAKPEALAVNVRLASRGVIEAVDHFIKSSTVAVGKPLDQFDFASNSGLNGF
jgi:hypothetical protein